MLVIMTRTLQRNTHKVTLRSNNTQRTRSIMLLAQAEAQTFVFSSMMDCRHHRKIDGHKEGITPLRSSAFLARMARCCRCPSRACWSLVLSSLPAVPVMAIKPDLHCSDLNSWEHYAHKRCNTKKKTNKKCKTLLCLRTEECDRAD